MAQKKARSADITVIKQSQKPTKARSAESMVEQKIINPTKARSAGIKNKTHKMNNAGATRLWELQRHIASYHNFSAMRLN
jgi:hypothetical protein